MTTVPFWLRKRAVEQGRTLRENLGLLNTEVVDGVQGLREVVAFGQGQRFIEALLKSSQSLVSAQVAHGRRAGGEQAATSVLITLGMVSIVIAAGLPGVLRRPCHPPSTRSPSYSQSSSSGQ